MIRSNKRKLLREKIAQLALEPDALAANITRLKGRAEYRLRVQDWRVIFRREGDILWIEHVGPRSRIYEE